MEKYKFGQFTLLFCRGNVTKCRALVLFVAVVNVVCWDNYKFSFNISFPENNYYKPAEFVKPEEMQTIEQFSPWNRQKPIWQYDYSVDRRLKWLYRAVLWGVNSPFKIIFQYYVLQQNYILGAGYFTGLVYTKKIFTPCSVWCIAEDIYLAANVGVLW